MPKIKNFEVSFDPVRKQKSGFWAITYSLAEPLEKHPFTAETMAEARQKIDALAARHGQPCHASVTCLDDRTPAGFREEFTFKSLYYNLGET